MSDDWIQFRTQLWDDPRVRKMSRLLRTHRGHVVGALVRFWSLADRFAIEIEGGGLLEGVTSEDINGDVGIENFVQTLPPDWCEVRETGLYLPQYQEHNGATAKRRLADAKRKRLSRKRPHNVRETSAVVRTNCGPDKIIEDRVSIGVPIDTSENRKPRKPDPIWDTIVAEFFPSLGAKVPKTTATRIGRVVRELRAFTDCTPAEIVARRKRMVREYGEMGDTPESLAKHWSHFGGNQKAFKEWSPT